MCQLCPYSCVAQHPSSHVWLCMLACQPCWARTEPVSVKAGQGHSAGSLGLYLAVGAYPSRELSALGASHCWKQRESPGSSHFIHLSIPCSGVRNSCSPKLLFPWRSPDLAQNQLLVFQLPLFGCLLGGSKARGCLAHSRAEAGLTTSRSTGWTIFQTQCCPP